MAGTKKTKRRVGEDVLRSEKVEDGLRSEKYEGREQASTPEKPPSPAKTESSEDTRESAASNVDAIEEDYAKEQDFLPDFIRNKKYSICPEEADKQLWEDIRKEDKRTGGSFVEQKFLKYLFIDARTRQAYVQMPSIYHQKVVQTLNQFVNSRSTPDNHVLALTAGGMDLKDGEGKKGGRKYPDIYIFGQDRTEVEEEYGFMQIREIGLEPMNPNVIIEVSWTNNLINELEKFALQMKECQIDDLGAINVGYLIKFIPREYFPNKDHPRRPLVGIDVYRMDRTQGMQPEEIADPVRVRRWRHGEDYPAALKLTGAELGQGPQGQGVSIPLRMIVHSLTVKGVVFETPNEN